MNFLRKLLGQKPATPAPSPAPTPSAPSIAATPRPNQSGPAAAPSAGSSPSASRSPLDPQATSSTGPAAEASFRFQAAPAPAPLETTLLTIPGPLWLPLDSPAVELFPAKSEHAPLIAFLGGSAELGAPDAPDHASVASSAGRLARILPFYLAEQVEFGADALACTLLSWIVKPSPGFILGAKNWDDATAARHARQSVAEAPADYLVVTHLICTRDPWTIELRLIRTIDAACLATATATCPAADPGRPLPSLARDLLALLAIHAVHAEAPSDSPTAPDTELPAPGSAYLLALDQLLAVLTAGFGPAAGRLSGEGEILENQLRLCVSQPRNVPLRLLFIHTLRALKKVRPAVVAEFQARATSLQTGQPLPEPARSVIQHILAEIFTG